jgi:hypothetical protein
VAVATVLDGARAGSRLLVWSAGHTFGDLGWPRLNQRVALYAEQLFERGVAVPSRKRFDVPGAPRAEISIDFAGRSRVRRCRRPIGVRKAAPER